MNVISKIIESWSLKPSENEMESILNWIEEKNAGLKVIIEKKCLSDSNVWFYDENNGEIRNKNNSFFQIKGVQQWKDDKLVLEQPILVQNEIGYLGVICKEIDGVLYLLMQAKIEPGNINKIQISPTIQATKSNFTQKHGGRRPAYLNYFLDVRDEDIIFDQIQSEQSSRFLGKRNRNTMIIVNDNIEVLPSHRWMTLGTIKELMKIDNLVNMDTRTVISCIPFSQYQLSNEELIKIREIFTDKALYNSVFALPSYKQIKKVFNYINNYKMLHNWEKKILPLTDLASWNITDDVIVHKETYAFKVVFCEIEIEGREVKSWTQPLFEANGMATFGLITSEIDGKLCFLVQAKPEVGCFDSIELAPTIQLEAIVQEDELSDIDKLFFELIEKGAKVCNNVVLSEEGGRFYHEQNKNVIIRIEEGTIGTIPEGYFWLDYATLNEMVQFNNVLNIQLRNLISLLEM